MSRSKKDSGEGSGQGQQETGKPTRETIKKGNP